MYRALYDYISSLNGYLSFKSGDQFTVIDKTRNDWYVAQNGFGEVGYVPHNYITDDNATLEEIIKFIDRSIEAINYESSRSGGLTAKLRDDLNKLLQHRTKIIHEFSQKPRTSDPQSPTKDLSKRSSLKRGAPPPPTAVDKVDTHHHDQTSVSHNTRSHDQSHQSSASCSAVPPPPTRTSSIKSSQMSESESSGLVNGAVDVRSDAHTTAEKKETAVVVNENELDVKHKQTEDVSGGSIPVENAQKEDSLGASIPGNEPNKEELLGASLPLSPSHKLLPTSPSRNFSSPAVINVKTITVPPNFRSEVVEEVRQHTGLSYDKSCVAVEVVLSHVANTMPQIAGIMDKILNTFQETGDDLATEASHDATQIEHLLSQLSDCKDDAQQRSWALHEDQHIILGYLEELLSILENAKPSICRKAVAKDGYDGVHNLVEYYQMETRTVIRLSALKVFGALCGLDAAVISHLLYSVLPLELINEIRTNYTDVQRLTYVSLVLTMVLCTGEPVPANLQEQLSEDFIDFVFGLEENPPSPDLEDMVEDELVNLILAINLQYSDQLTNTVLDVVQRRGTVKVFTEKLLLLFNRGDDPVKMFDHQTSQPHSVLKLLIDIYNRPETSNLLYTNDAKVLVDIVLRQLMDLPVGDQLRSINLTLMYSFVKNSDYLEYKYRIEELCSCLKALAEEDMEGTREEDKAISGFILEMCQA